MCALPRQLNFTAALEQTLTSGGRVRVGVEFQISKLRLSGDSDFDDAVMSNASHRAVVRTARLERLVGVFFRTLIDCARAAACPPRAPLPSHPQVIPHPAARSGGGLQDETRTGLAVPLPHTNPPHRTRSAPVMLVEASGNPSVPSRHRVVRARSDENDNNALDAPATKAARGLRQLPCHPLPDVIFELFLNVLTACDADAHARWARLGSAYGVFLDRPAVEHHTVTPCMVAASAVANGVRIQVHATETAEHSYAVVRELLSPTFGIVALLTTCITHAVKTLYAEHAIRHLDVTVRVLVRVSQFAPPCLPPTAAQKLRLG